MINVLDEPLRTTIETLLRRGVGQRQIHRLTQVDRKTIRRRPKPDFAQVLHELSRKHVTRRQLWREYLARYPQGYRYTSFCVQLLQWRRSVGADDDRA